MNIVITGGAGFLGTMLTRALMARCPELASLKIVDRLPLPRVASRDSRLTSVVADITDAADIGRIVDRHTTHVFHLAAIVSSHAEEDFDLGLKVNLLATHMLLERCRRINPAIRFVFSSSLAVFGGELPERVERLTATQPSSSYGTQKAMCELLVNDYGRRGLVDALSVRLPTICIRPGRPNQAASSFVSGIIREPLKSERSNCPVKKDLPLWISSPATVIDNIIHASLLKAKDLPAYRTFNLPGIQVTPEQMLAALAATVGQDCLSLVSHTPDPAIERIVASWPHAFNNDKELALGFSADPDFQAVLTSYLSHYPAEDMTKN